MHARVFWAWSQTRRQCELRVVIAWIRVLANDFVLNPATYYIYRAFNGRVGSKESTFHLLRSLESGSR